MSSERQWSVMCPDGEVWPDLPESEEAARASSVEADEQCDCETAGHQVVTRRLGWEVV